MKKISIFIIALIILSVSLVAVFAIEGERDELQTPDDYENIFGEKPKPYVYIGDSGNDTNDGQSYNNSVKTLERAYELLNDEGGIIIVCDKLTLNSPYTLLSSEHDIEYTSYYEGVDYQSDKGAEIFFHDTLNIKSEGKITFYGIKLHSEKKASIYCNGTNVEFGTRIENLSDDQAYPSLYGGTLLEGSCTADDGNFSNYQITVSSGYWHSVTLGNNRNVAAAPMSLIKNATLQINGGSFMAGDNEAFTTSAVSGAYVSDNITFEINGGVFYGSVYAIGNEGEILPFMDLNHSANVTFKITNGTFSGNYIKALYSKNARLNGSYSFIAENGSFSALTYVGCEGVQGEINLSSCESVQSKLYGFEKTVFLSSNGNDENSGESPSSAKKTLSGAFAALPSGGSIVICSDFTLTDGFQTRNTDQKIRITSKYFDNDYSLTDDAVLNISGNINLRSDITFDSIKIKTDSTATFCCYGSVTEFANNVTTEGDIAVIIKRNENSHTFIMSSGSFSLFSFESSPTSTYISIKGGSIELFNGCSELHLGDIFADFSGGIINGNVNIAPNGTSGNIQLIVGNAQIHGSISTQRPDTDRLCEALVVYNYDKTKLSGFDIIEDKYVFVKDGADGNGSTPSLAAPSLDDALAYIGNSNAVVVFCGKTSFKNDYAQKSTGILTYSSIYRNIDFSKINGACLVLFSDYYFDNDATIENLKIISGKKNLTFHCNSNIVIFGQGLVCEIPSVNNSYFPSVIANDDIPANPYNDKGESLSDKIIIQSGTWNNIYASAASEIIGGTVKGALFGTNDLSNNCSVTISGGVIYGGIYAAVHAKENASSHITITFNAGEIHGVISPSYQASSGYSGRFLINISGGDFDGVEKINNASFIGGGNSKVNIKDDIDIDAYPDSLIGYFSPVSNAVSAITYANGMWYLAKAEGTEIILYRSNTVAALKHTLPIYKTDVENTVTELSLSFEGTTMYIFAKAFSTQYEMNIYVSKSLDEGTFDFYKLQGNDIKDYTSPCIVSYNGEKYMYYALQGEAGSDIYCAKIDSALNLLSDAVSIIKADAKWEGSYLSSPRMIKAPDGKIYIAYTGGNINGGSSMIGIAFVTSSNLLSASSYQKNPDPVFYETDTHKNIVLSSIINIDGAPEQYFSYSSRVNGEHCLIMQSFSFDGDNAPYFDIPCQMNTLYLAHYVPRNFKTLLSGFEINRTANVPGGSEISRDFSFVKLLKENFIIILISFSVIMLVIVIMIIRKYSQNPQNQLKKNQKERSRNDRMRATRLNVGREYAAKLQQIEQEEKAQQQEQAFLKNENSNEALNVDDGESYIEADEAVEDIVYENGADEAQTDITEALSNEQYYDSNNDTDSNTNDNTDINADKQIVDDVIAMLEKDMTFIESDANGIKKEAVGVSDTKKKHPRARKEI